MANKCFGFWNPLGTGKCFTAKVKTRLGYATRWPSGGCCCFIKPGHVCDSVN